MTQQSMQFRLQDELGGHAIAAVFLRAAQYGCTLLLRHIQLRVPKRHQLWACQVATLDWKSIKLYWRAPQSRADGWSEQQCLLRCCLAPSAIKAETAKNGRSSLHLKFLFFYGNPVPMLEAVHKANPRVPTNSKTKNKKMCFLFFCSENTVHASVTVCMSSGRWSTYFPSMSFMLGKYVLHQPEGITFEDVHVVTVRSWTTTLVSQICRVRVCPNPGRREESKDVGREWQGEEGTRHVQLYSLERMKLQKSGERFFKGLWEDKTSLLSSCWRVFMKTHDFKASENTCIMIYIYIPQSVTPLV